MTGGQFIGSKRSAKSDIAFSSANGDGKFYEATQEEINEAANKHMKQWVSQRGSNNG